MKGHGGKFPSPSRKSFAGRILAAPGVPRGLEKPLKTLLLDHRSNEKTKGTYSRKTIHPLSGNRRQRGLPVGAQENLICPGGWKKDLSSLAQTKEPDQGSGTENLAPIPSCVMGMPSFGQIPLSSRPSSREFPLLILSEGSPTCERVLKVAPGPSNPSPFFRDSGQMGAPRFTS